MTLRRPTRPAQNRGLPHDLLALVAGGEAALDAAREAVAFVLDRGADDVNGRRIRLADDEIQLCAPLPRPNSLRDYMVVEEHMRNCVAKGMLPSIPEEWFNIPAYYKGNVDEIYGPDDVVPWPSYTDRLDYELEVCAVIGAPGAISARLTLPAISLDTRCTTTGALVISRSAR